MTTYAFSQHYTLTAYCTNRSRMLCLLKEKYSVFQLVSVDVAMSYCTKM